METGSNEKSDASSFDNEGNQKGGLAARSDKAEKNSQQNYDRARAGHRSPPPWPLPPRVMRLMPTETQKNDNSRVNCGPVNPRSSAFEANLAFHPLNAKDDCVSIQDLSFPPIVHPLPASEEANNNSLPPQRRCLSLFTARAIKGLLKEPQRQENCLGEGGGGDCNPQRVQSSDQIESLELPDLPEPQVPQNHSNFLEKNDNGSRCIVSKIKHCNGVTFSMAILAFIFILSYVACSWICLFHEVYDTIPRTFAWELIIRILGSHYEDCMDHSNPEAPLMSVQVREQCPFSFSLPWIPLIGAITSILTATIALVFVSKLFCFKQSCKFCLNIMLLLCAFELLHFAYAVLRVYNITGFRSSDTGGTDLKFLKGQMFATMKYPEEQVPQSIHFRWNISQTQLECCGIYNWSEWKYQIFRTGDARYPKSCCNTKTTKNWKCKSHYPTRFEVWKDGCLQPELKIVRRYRNAHLVLLLVSVLAKLLINLSTIQLAIFAKTHNISLFTPSAMQYWIRCGRKVTKTASGVGPRETPV